MRRLATLGLLLAFAACDSTPAGPVTPPMTPPTEPPVTPPVDPPLPEAFSLAVTVLDASGAPVSGLPVSLHFFPTGRSRPAARPAVISLSPVYPSPWAGRAAVQFALSDASTVRLELLNVLGESRRVLVDDVFAAGQHQLVFGDEGGTLPGGVYTVRLIAGADTLTTRTIHSDTNGDGFEAVGRALGTTDASGQVRTTDRTAAPAFYIPNEDVGVFDEVGNDIGTVRFGLDLAVVVDLPDGQQVRSVVTIRDGANAVEVRVP